MKLSLGIQTFSKLRELEKVYVDKTRQIFEIVDQGGYYFLSRPRRFGKSLTLSTLAALYEGKRTLFRDLWIENHWDWASKKRPVVQLSFSNISYQTKGLEKAIADEICFIAEEHDITLGGDDKDYPARFRSLLRKLAQRDGRVVLLIDEYDKPIIDVIDVPEAIELRKANLKAFYSVLKNSDDYLELVFITGVSAFSKVSIFSDLNNLQDLTLADSAATLVGISPEELYQSFGGGLKDADREELRTWYNGYSWDGRNRLYNPWSILTYIETKRIDNYWFHTGHPSFLTKIMKRQGVFKLPELASNSSALLSSDTTFHDLVPVLFQTGYLTVASPPQKGGKYQLTYPNLEVRQSLDLFLLAEYSTGPVSGISPRIQRVWGALQQKNLELLFSTLNINFADIAYDHWSGQNEHFFHALTYLTFRLAGLETKSEVHTAKGRCDVLVETDHYIYAFEFKMDRPAKTALQQIKEKGYLDAYADDPRQSVAVGVRFDSTEKRITDWLVD